MKHLAVFLLCCSAAFTAFSQEVTDAHINKVDLKGRKQGLWKVYDSNGNLKYIGYYANNKPIGGFTYYYPSGRVKASLNYLDSGLVSYAKNYHPNGMPLAQGKYVNQHKDSTWLYFSEEDGTLSAEEHYENFMKEGIWKTFYPDGKVAEEITYRKDIKDGPWIQYFSDGSVKLKATYVNDKLEGLYVIYHLNGNVEVSGTFVNSLKHGTWVYFRDNGELEKREEYELGKLLKPDVIKE